MTKTCNLSITILDQAYGQKRGREYRALVFLQSSHHRKRSIGCIACLGIADDVLVVRA